VTRFMARHPLVAASVMLLAHLGLLVGYGLIVLLILASQPPDWFHCMVFTVVNTALPFGIALWLALLRRRSGASAAPLWWLVALVPIELLVHVVAGIAIVTVTLQGPTRLLGELRELLEDPQWWMLVLLPYGYAWSAPATLLGILAGLTVARWKLRTGRWETIVPVDRLGRARQARGDTP